MTPAIVALALSVYASPIRGQEWPRFRGPNGSGIAQASGMPTQWTDKDYKWKIELPGVGHSSPVINGTRLFITGCQESDGTLDLLALHVADGRTLWRRTIKSSTYPKNRSNTYASSTPALDQTRLYFAWATPEQGWLAACEQATGRELWRRELGPYDAEHGFGVSPIVVGSMVILPNDQNGPSSILAFDGATGRPRWKAERRVEKAAYATPCLYQPPQGPAQLIVPSWAHGVSSLDPETGRSNWELPVFALRVVGSPLAAGGLVFAHCKGGRGKQMVAVRTDAAGRNPEIAYDMKGPLPYATTPVADPQRLYLFGDQGIVTCQQLADGKELWRERTNLKFFGSPILACGRLYCIDREGRVLVLAAADRYQVLGQVELGAPSHATPAVAGNVMYLRTVSHLMALPGK